jgi:integrase/recombinase XerD
VVRVQKIKVPDTGRLSWIVIDGEHIPVGVVNEYLTYLHRLGRSPNTVRAYAHHLQAYWAFLVEQKHDWRKLKLNQLAEFVSWVRHATRAGGGHRSDATINLDPGCSGVALRL